MNKVYILTPLALSVTLLIFPFVTYFGNNLMVVTSDSMIPTLNPNDLLIVKKTELTEVEVGDIITFDSHVDGIGIVAHRVVEKFDKDGKISMRTQGDNVVDADTWTVHEEDIYGKVVENISYIGILLVEPVRYMLFIIIIITTITLLHEIVSATKLKANS